MFHARRWSLSSTILLATSILTAPPAFAWGERGHDLIARVAVRLCPDRGGDVAFCKTLAMKEHMLAHLSNVPDIVWKNLPKQSEPGNDPAHYIDVEYVVSGTPTLANVPYTFIEASRRATESKRVIITDVGTLPWRMNQFANAAGDAWKTGVEPALLASGLLAHFVGDLTMPFHATADYDGYDMGQGGIHSWYETIVMYALPLEFDAEVYHKALKARPFDNLAKTLSASKRSPTDPLDIAWGLALESNRAIPAVLRVDRDFAVLKPSTKTPTKVPAQRKPAPYVMERFRPLLRDQLALGADTLIHLWIMEWERGGKVPLADYRSYYYPVAPDYVRIDYAK